MQGRHIHVSHIITTMTAGVLATQAVMASMAMTLPFSSHMNVSSNGNIFRVTSLSCGKFTGRRWIPRTKASDAGLWCFLWSTWNNRWANNGDAGDLRRHRAHYDVIGMPNIPVSVSEVFFKIFDVQCAVLSVHVPCHSNAWISRWHQGEARFNLA